MSNVAEKRDIQSRKWSITINNPTDQYSHQVIKEKLEEFKSIIYWCMADEKGLKESTYHTHIYLLSSSPIRFSTLKKRFYTAHIEKANGTTEENRNYVFKIGKWENDSKSETQINGTREEFGEVPKEGQGKRSDLLILYEMIKEGLTNFEIMERCSDYITKIDTIERVRQTIREEQYKDVFRDMKVTYIYGKTGTGKSRGVMEQYGYSNIFRCTDYLHAFDGYRSQDIVIFEEFRSSIKIGEMLVYLDGYPCELPSRYVNKVACYTKVYIISNISLHQQYTNIQEEEKATWEAFLRRINKVIHYTDTNVYREYTTKEFIDGDFVSLEDETENPFIER
ncbi:MAG: replication protein [Velocimicrobium sp.]